MPEDHERPDRTDTGQDGQADEPTERIQFLSGNLDNKGGKAQQPPDQGGDAQSSADPTVRASADQADQQSVDDESERETKPRMSPPSFGGTASGSGDSRAGSGPNNRAGSGPNTGGGANMNGGTTQLPPESDSERTDDIPAVVDNRPGPDESDSERTQTIPAMTSEIPGIPAPHPPPGQPTAYGAAGAYGPPNHGLPPQGPPPSEPPTEQRSPNGDGSNRRRTLIRSGIAAGIAFGVLLLVYIGDLAFSSGQVPRGTTVANVAVGGMDHAAAERKLRDEIGPRLEEPIELRVGKTSAEIEPGAAGLSMDWQATLDKAGSQPLNPITRVTSLFTSREIEPVSNVDRAKLRGQLEQVSGDLHRDPVEGTIRFEGAEPVAVLPVTGQNVDIQRSVDVVIDQWALKGPVVLPYTTKQVKTTEEGVRRTLREVAQPAVSAPVTVRGEGVEATLTPEQIGSAMRFEPNGNGGLKWHLDIPTATEAVKPQLESTLKPGKDATFKFEGGKPVVQPSKTGRTIDWKKTFAPLRKVLTESGEDSVKAVYKDKPANLTTEEAKKLGIKEKVSEFQTGGFSKDSGVNIRQVAKEVDGAIVKPGEVFSLNGHTGIRQEPQGYIKSGIIKNGVPAKAVGGGISQFATTLYNASYFAGMKDIEHKAHSYYISRYPMGREATVFQRPDGTSLIDVKFKNVSDSGILIKTNWTPQSVTVTFWGTKQFDVKSKTSDKTNVKEPKKTTVPPGKPCIETNGKKGFTVYDTRIKKNLKTGETTRQRQKTVYDPEPIVKCRKKTPPPPG